MEPTKYPEKYEVPKYEITPGYKEPEYQPTTSTEYKKEPEKPTEEPYIRKWF